MKHIKTKTFAVASGITGSVIYIGCYIIMAILPEKILIKLANLIFHGVDFSNSLRMNITLTETFIGIVASFIFWGGLGYLLAFIYNKIN